MERGGTPARGAGPGAAGRCVSVLPALPLPGPWDYLDGGLDLEPGALVEVPAGGRRVVGAVLGEGTGGVAAARLKPVLRRFDAPPLPRETLAFVDWVAAYTLSPPGAVLRMAAGVPAALSPPPPVLAYARAAAAPDEGARQTPARRRVLELLADGPPRAATDIAREAGVSPSVPRGMARAGLLATVALPGEARFPAPDPDRPPAVAFNPAQRAAAARLAAAARAGRFSVAALDGVTGSGKTEVYFEAVAETLRQGRQALVLVPEIALSAPFLARFEARFGAPPAEWHSDLPPGRRRAVWRGVADGRVRALVGARSALFLPFPDLGLVVVDEEHDAAFKQEDGVPYQGRDMAVVRARIGGAAAVLASATPSLETVVNIARGRYERVPLPARAGAAGPPEVRAIDLRREGPERGRWIAPRLVRAVGEALGRGEQALLFLNRRGYAPLTLCRACGHRMACPNCAAWLVEHRGRGRLVCHHCGHAARRPEACPECGAEDGLAAAGPGVERLEEEVRWCWPEARVRIASSDTLSGPGAAAEFARAVAGGEADIVVGTQVAAKGHHFPLLTVAGAVDADLGLSGGDLRAGERTYQLLHQLAGRAGRAERPGRVFLQTHMPDGPAMRALAAWDRDGFLAEEARAREEAGMPPFGRLVALVVAGREAERADEAARALARSAPRFSNVLVLGPAPAPLALLRGRHRRRLLLKAGREVNVQKVVRDWLAPLKFPPGVRVSVDVDPYGFQ